MPNDRDRLKELDRLEPPELWAEIERRQPHGEVSTSLGPGTRSAAILVALLVAVAASVFLMKAFDGDGLTGPADRRDAGAVGPELFLAGDGEMWIVDADTSTVRHLDLPYLAPGDPPHRISAGQGKLVVWGYETYVLDPSSLQTPPMVLAKDSWIFLPSSRPGRVWLGILDPQSPSTERALSFVREVTVDGTVTQPDTEPPAGRWPVAALEEGLVFEVGDSLEVWDPRTRMVVERLPGAFPLAWQGHRLAWCDARCDEVRITDLSTHETVRVPVPEGAVAFQALEGEFSPDGTLLALIAQTDPGADADRQLVLVDVSSGRASTVGGARVRPPYAFVAWSSSGESVFVAGGERGGEHQLVQYRPSNGSVRDLAATVGDFYDIAAI
jgi:hypothetical protein